MRDRNSSFALSIDRAQVTVLALQTGFDPSRCQRSVGKALRPGAPATRPLRVGRLRKVLPLQFDEGIHQMLQSLFGSHSGDVADRLRSLLVAWCLPVGSPRLLAKSETSMPSGVTWILAGSIPKYAAM
jgi:hypothetical protein